MMRRKPCFRAASRLHSYLDGEIRAIRRIRIRLHLRLCPNCKRAYRFEKRLRRFVRERARVDAPPEVVDRVRRLIRERSS